MIAQIPTLTNLLRLALKKLLRDPKRLKLAHPIIIPCPPHALLGVQPAFPSHACPASLVLFGRRPFFAISCRSSIFSFALHTPSSYCASSHHHTLRIPLFRLSRLLTFLDLPNHSLESLANILVISRRSFHETAAQLVGQLFPVRGGDLALFGTEVGFVGYDHEGDGVGAQMIQNLIPNNPHHLKTLLGRNTIHNHIPMNADKMFGIEDRVFVLAGRVDDFYGEVLGAVADHFAEGVFYRGVVAVDEVAVDELHGEGGFADRSTPNNSHFALFLLRRHDLDPFDLHSRADSKCYSVLSRESERRKKEVSAGVEQERSEVALLKKKVERNSVVIVPRAILGSC